MEAHKFSRECGIYVNMPPFGLGKAGSLQPVGKERETAKQRFEAK
jgi:hypothetical protein